MSGRSSFSIKEALAFGWRTVKGNLWFFIKLQIAAFLILIVMSLISVLLEKVFPLQQAGALSITLVILSLTLGIVFSIVPSVIYIGFIKISLRFCDDETPEFIELFSHYRLIFKYLFASLFFAVFVFGGAGLISLGFLSEAVSGILKVVPAIAGTVLAIFLSLTFFFSPYAVVDKGFGPLNALRVSYLITKGAKLRLFLFLLLILAVNFVGALLLVVGLLITIPLTMVAFAHIYRGLATAAEESGSDLSAKGIRENMSFIIALIVAATVAAGALFMVYQSTFGSGLAQEARHYADNTFTQVFSRWDADKLLAEASPEFFSAMPGQQAAEQTKNLFKDASEKLGMMKIYNIVSQEFKTSRSPEGKQQTFVQYTVQCVFERGKAQILFTLIHREGKWKIYGFRWSLFPAAASQQPAVSEQPQVQKPQDKPAEKAIAKPADKPADKPVAKAQDVKDAIKPGAYYEYTAGSRRDPFVPLIVKADAKPAKGLTPMESYEVAEFKLIAILWDNSKYYAVITLPDGKSYTAREGVKMGLHGGKIYKITKDSVIIREHVRDYRGVLSPKDTVLKLRMEEEG
ncbi:MAG: pilus assembly protein PilP [Nitrospirae bacterium]|nr:pilus assembly protein PilP [Nitrospirota bacterium]